MTGNKESESQALEVGKFVAFIIISSPLTQTLQNKPKNLTFPFSCSTIKT